MGSPPPRACLDARKYAELNRSILPRTTRRTRQSTLSTRAQYFAARPGERARKSKKGGRTAAFCFPARALHEALGTHQRPPRSARPLFVSRHSLGRQTNR